MCYSMSRSLSMFCENCGEKRNADEVFCERCKKPFEEIEETLETFISKGIKNQDTLTHKIEESISSTNKITENPSTKTIGNIIVNGSELQWLYEFSFWKNPTLLITVAKVLLISLFVPTLLMFVITLNDGFVEAFKLSTTILGYGIILFAILLAIAYPLIAVRYGGKYFVLFKMDTEGVNHIQLDKQFKKAQALGFLTALIGLSVGNLTTGGAGLMAATKQSLYTSFKKVKSIKSVKSRNIIYVNETLTRNQIYAKNEDFDFVLEHIISKCPKNVRIKRK